MKNSEARRDELESLFKEVNELEEGVWSEDDYEVFPKAELAEVKAQIKALGGELKEINRDIKNKEKQVKALKKAGESFKAVEKEIVPLTPKVDELTNRIAEQGKRIARHAELYAELKACKKIIKEIKDKKDKLVEEARKKSMKLKPKDLLNKRQWK